MNDSKLKILVVDDNRDNATTLAMLLTLLGSEVLAVNDGQSAISSVETFRPEVILLDLGMPGINGFEACKAIRETHGSTVMIIAQSGWGQETDVLRCRESGFDDHLLKPLTLEHLNSLLEKARARFVRNSD